MVCFDTPTSRATSSALRPASSCFSAPIICASVCLLFDIPLPLSFVRNHTRTCSESGEQLRYGSSDWGDRRDAKEAKHLGGWYCASYAKTRGLAVGKPGIKPPAD